jgi:hypothetical protein
MHSAYSSQQQQQLQQLLSTPDSAGAASCNSSGAAGHTSHSFGYVAAAGAGAAAAAAEMVPSSPALSVYSQSGVSLEALTSRICEQYTVSMLLQAYISLAGLHTHRMLSYLALPAAYSQLCLLAFGAAVLMSMSEVKCMMPCLHKMLTAAHPVPLVRLQETLLQKLEERRQQKKKQERRQSPTKQQRRQAQRQQQEQEQTAPSM